MINSLAKIYQIIPLKYYIMYIRVIEDLFYLHIFNEYYHTLKSNIIKCINYSYLILTN